MKIFVINNFSPKHQIGGSEVQCWLIAKYLARLGHTTAYVAVENLANQNRKESGEGFDILYLINKNQSKLKVITNFYKLLKRQKPQVAYIRIFKYLYPFSKICAYLKIPVVFNTSHIKDCQPGLVGFKFNLNPIKFLKNLRIIVWRRLNFKVLKKVKVITINKHHARLLKAKYDIQATPIYNSMEDNYQLNFTDKKKQIVWVNNIKARKRPELFIKLANQFKEGDYKFIMIGEFQNMVDQYKEMVQKCQEENPNFQHLSITDPAEVDKVLAASCIYVNTCQPEGFGNTFIMAWLNECPTVTLNFDADDIIVSNKIGYHSGTFEQMVKDLSRLMEDENLRQTMGKRAREYALQNHSILSNIKKYEALFKAISVNYE